MSLQQRTILFDEVLHKYTDECGNPYTSATQLIGKYEKQFNHRYWCMYTALKNSGYILRPCDSENYIYVNRKRYHIDDLYKGYVYLRNNSIEDITQEWKEKNRVSCERGTGIHNFIEDKINLLTGTENDTFNIVVLKSKTSDLKFSYKKEIKHLSDFDSELSTKYPIIFAKVKVFFLTGWKVYAELRVYHPDYLIAGTIDLVAINHETGEFKILDWKTNKKELHFKSGYYRKINGIETNDWVQKNSFFKFPIDDIEDCKGEGYTLQLSLYAYILECWGFTCTGLAIVHIMPNKPEKFIKIKYRKQSVEDMMIHHFNNLNIKKQTLISIN